jgi:hypothetical protein
MANSAISDTKKETNVAEASGEIVEGSPTAMLAPMVTDTITGDLDASDISFPRLQIVQGMGNLSENFKKGELVLDGETSIYSDGSDPVEFTVVRIGKMFEENINWDEGEIPRILNKADAVAAGGSFEWGMNGEQPDWKPIADALVCIKGEDANVYPFDFDGTNYAFALWRIKGTAYKRAAVPIFTASRMYYRDGLHNGTFLLSTDKAVFGGKTVHVPKLKRGTRNTSEFVTWIKDFS